MSVLRPRHVPKTEAERHAYQITLERVQVGLTILFMTIAGITFIVFPNIPLYVRFSQDFHTLITPIFFFALSFIGVALAPGIYIFRDRLDVVWKRQLSILCFAGLIIYTLAIGIYAWLTGTMGFTILIYILFLLPFIQSAFAIHRE